MNTRRIITKISFFAVATFFALTINSVAKAQLFSQNFSSSTVGSDYVSATPNNGQFNAIGSANTNNTVVNINNGTLQFARSTLTGSAGSFSRTTDFGPVPSTLTYKIDITVSNNTTAQTSAAIFQVGSGFGTANGAESNVNTYARFAINLSATTGCFTLRDITNGTNSAEFCGAQTITWVLNNIGATLSYTDPNNMQQSLLNDRADIYLGNTLVFNDVAVQTPTQTITDLKFAFTDGVGIIQLDNILINPISSPTAGGRVTEANGRGIFRARVTLIDSQGFEQYAYTNPQGYYSFPDVPGGQTYIFTVRHLRYQFAAPSLVEFVDEDNPNINFVSAGESLRPANRVLDR